MLAREARAWEELEDSGENHAPGFRRDAENNPRDTGATACELHHSPRHGAPYIPRTICLAWKRYRTRKKSGVRAGRCRLMNMKGLNLFACALLLAATIPLNSRAGEASTKLEVELTVEMPEPITTRTGNVSFSVTFHNNGTDDLLLNGGELLGNGAEIWSSLEADLKGANGEQIPISFGWGVPGVAGRIYFLGVPLRPKSSYKLLVQPSDYFAGSGERLRPGRYVIRFVYRSRQSPYRDATQMPACWEGEAWSNALSFEVR